MTGEAARRREQVLARMQRVDGEYDSTVMCRCGATATWKLDVSRLDAFLDEHAPHVLSDEPKTLTEADIVAAIDGLAAMVEAAGGDLSTKATLAATSFRVAAANKGHAWAVVHVGPIVARLREQARGAGALDSVEAILFGIPQAEGPSQPGHSNLPSVPPAGTVAPVTDADLAWVRSAAATAREDPRSSEAHRALAGMATRLADEVRRLRAEITSKG